MNVEKRKSICENGIGFDKEKQGEVGKDEEKSCPRYNMLTYPSSHIKLALRAYTYTMLMQYFRSNGLKASKNS